MSRILRRLARFRRSEAAPAPAYTPRDLRARLWLSALEDRSVPATFMVTTAADNAGGVNPAPNAGTGTLRQAVVNANATAGADIIQFDTTLFATPQVITLLAALPAFTSAGGTVVLQGTGARNSIVSGNNAFRPFNLAASANVTFNDMTIANGQSTGVGGGIFVASAGALTINRSTVSGNASVGAGGGVYFYSGGSFNVTESTFGGNSGGGVGGGAAYFFGGVTATISNSTFFNNSSNVANGGGAFRLQSFSGSLTIRNSTLTGNTAGANPGGAISGTGGTVTIFSSIVSGNTGAASGPEISRASGITNFNFSAASTTTGFTPTGSNNQIGQVLNLGTLLNNGGPTDTVALGAGSFAIDRGSNTLGSFATDQRGVGYTRTFGSATDIGAFEVQPVGLPAASASAPNVSTPGGTSHTITVVYTDATGTNNGILASSLDNSDVTVTAPGGATLTTTFVGATPAGNGTPRTATYTLTPPGGSWDAADNGTYTLNVIGGQVSDQDGNFVPGGTMGTFTVTVPLVVMVTNAADSGPGSLRDAINQNNASLGAGFVTFDPTFFNAPRTILLTTGALTITDAVTITGPGAGFATVNGNGTGQVFAHTATGAVTIDGLTITGGSGGNGSGIGVSTAGADLTVRNAVITGNAGGTAGGIFLTAGAGLLTVQSSTISGNIGGTGGIYFFSGGSLLVQNSTISGNTGTSTAGFHGGAVVFYGAVGAGGVVVQNSTIVNNTTSSVAGGGGINFANLSGTANVRNSTITGNTAPTGAGGGGGIGLYGTGIVNLINTVVAENTGPTASPDVRAASGTFVGQNSLIGVGPAALGGTGNQTGTAALPLDPKLGPLMDNGGPTLTRAPLAGSPLLNLGNSALVGTLTTDQRGPGGVRIFGSAVDIGAVEVQPLPPVVTVVGGTVTYTENGPALTLEPTLTITDLNSTTLAGATVQITAGLDAANDVLAFTPIGGITGSYTAATGLLQLSGTSSLANYQAVLRSVTFVSNGENPTPGNRTITFRVTDLDTPTANTSAPVTKTVTVVAVNDVPVLLNLPGTTTTPDSASVSPFDLMFLTDLDAASVTVTVTFNNTNGALTPTAGGSVVGGTFTFVGAPFTAQTALRGLVFTPTLNLAPLGSGITTVFSLSVTDDATPTPAVTTDNSTTVVAINVNDAPSFTISAAPVVTDEDSATLFVSGFVTSFVPGPAEESGQTADGYEIEVLSNPSLGAPFVSPAGDLSFTPALDEFGTATYRIRVRDTGGVADGGVDLSGWQTFSVTVNPVNDYPGFGTVGSSSALEDSGAVTQLGFVTFFNPGFPANESGQSVLAYPLVVLSGGELFTTGPAVDAAGTLTYTLAPDAFGNAWVQIQVQDDGGTDFGGVDLSFASFFLISVSAVNDAPSFTAASPAASAEDSGPVSVPGFVTAFDAGPDNEDAIEGVLGYEVEVLTGGSLFAANPFIVSSGELLYTPAANAYGTATFRARVMDSGGVADGGVDLSAWQTFTVTVTPTNDAPENTPLLNVAVVPNVFTALTGLSVTEPTDGAAAGGPRYTATVSVPTGEGEFALTRATTATVSGQNTESITFTGTLAEVNDGLAALSFRPTGTGTVDITIVSDDGGNGGAGAALGDTDTFVVAIKQKPVVAAGGGSAAFVEGAGPVAVAPALLLTDVDSTIMSVAVVSITGGFLPGEDVLAFAAGALPAGVMAVASAGTITFTGEAPIGAYQALLRTVTYANTSDTPGLGARTVSFTVTDELATNLVSDPDARDVNVDDTNDAPVNAVAVGTPSVNEDLTVSVPGVTVSDVDLGANPIRVTLSTPDGTLTATGAGVTIGGSGGPTLTIEGPAAAVNSALGNLAFTPAADFFGTATIQILTDDLGSTGGPAETDADSFTVTVSPVNDAPSFTPGGNVTVIEDSGTTTVGWATAVSFGPANEAPQTVSFLVTTTTGAGLFTVLPAIDAAGVLTFTVRTDAVGTASVTVRAQDTGGGTNTSAPVTFDIVIAPVNDTPSFSAGPNIEVTEDSGPRSFAGWARGISTGPNDEVGQTVTFVVGTTNPTLFATAPAVDSNGTLTFTPAADANGVATVTVRVRDSGGGPNDTSAPQTFTITLISLNDPPRFLISVPGITAGPGTAPVSLPNFVTNIETGPADEAGQTVLFEVTNNGEVLFSAQPAISPDGTLTFTPAAFRSGTATVTVRLRDSGGDTFGVDVTPPVQTFTISLTGSNSAPSFNAGPVQVVAEDAGAQTVTGWATNISAGMLSEAGQTLTFLVSSSLPSLFSVPPAIDPTTGTLTYTPAADAVGTANVTVRLMDSGGTQFGGVDTSAPQTFTIQLTAVNDPPVFTIPTGPVASDPANGARTEPGFATGIAAGPANETGQSLTFLVTVTSGGGLFTAQPAINPMTGALTFTPAAGANGTATVSVRLQDNGGGANLSAPQTFTIVVAPGAQNSPPTTGNDAITVAFGSTPTAVPVLANDSFTPDTGETLSVTAVGAAGNGLATLTGGQVLYAPGSGFSGTDTFSYTISDGNGGTATGTVTVTVSPPVITPPTPPTPTPTTVVRDLVAIGDQTGSRVRVVNVATGQVQADFLAFPGFGGGVNATLADVTGDGVADVIVGAGAGGGPVVKVFDGRTFAEVASFYAFLPSLRGGVHVAAGDVNGDGRPDLILGAGAGGGPHVKVVDGKRLGERDADNLPTGLLASFFAYANDFLGGVSVAAGDVNGDGRADVVTGAGPGGSPHVKVYDGATLREVLSVIPYNRDFRGGVNVGAGDLDGDGLAEIITGAGAGGGPHVGIYHGKTAASKGQFFAFPPSDTNGVTVAVRPLSGGGATLVTASGSGALTSYTAGVADDLLEGTILGGITVG